MDSALPALHISVERLHELRQRLHDGQLEMPSYASEWSVAEVLSHLGSGAVIMRRTLDDALAGQTAPDGFAPSVWDVWNAKLPRAQADDALVTDEALVDAFEALTDAERRSVAVPMGPLSLTFEQAVGMRLNEHALHTWDVEVTFDDDARIPDDVAAAVLENLAVIVGFAGRPTGESADITIHTTGPEHDFVVRLSPESVTLEEGTATAAPDLVLPAEALCRLVYGRLDPGHTPESTEGSAVLGVLRQVFPGF